MRTKSLSTRRPTTTKTLPLPGDRIVHKGMQGVLLSTDGKLALRLLKRYGGVSPIPLPCPLNITGKQLKRFNAESIRLGFSRNLKNLKRIPDDLNIPIFTAFRHVSADPIPKRNIRLMFSLPTFIPPNWREQIKKVVKSLTNVFLDVTPDTFAAIRRQKVQCR